MKRALALILALVLCLALVACGNEEKEEAGNPTTGANSTIVAFMKENGDAFLENLESGFKVSGMTCKSSYQVVGNGLVVTICVNELNNVDSATKDAMQEAYTAMASTFDQALKMLQQEITELESLTIRVCEKDGDLLADLKVGK